MFEFLNTKTYVVICAGKQSVEDSFCASLCVGLLCLALNKQPLLFSSLALPACLEFLPFANLPTAPTNIHDKTNGGIVAFNCDVHEIQYLSYLYTIPRENIFSIQGECCCEQLVQHIKMSPHTAITPDMATALFAGIVLYTNNFRTLTTPQTLRVAEYLVSMGAHKELVVYHLYKTFSLSFMHALGLILERFTSIEEIKTSWSYITLDEAQTHGLRKQDIPLLMREIHTLAGDLDSFILGIQTNKTLLCVCSLPEKQQQFVIKTYNATQRNNLVVLPLRTHRNPHEHIQRFALHIHGSTKHIV